MNTKSCKAKARRLQNSTARDIAELLDCKVGPDEPVAPREMGQAGTDIRLVGEVLKSFPWSVECKNCEKWQPHQWIKQAKENCLSNTNWLVVFKRNRSEIFAMLDFKVANALVKHPRHTFKHLPKAKSWNLKKEADKGKDMLPVTFMRPRERAVAMMLWSDLLEVLRDYGKQNGIYGIQRRVDV